MEQHIKSDLKIMVKEPTKERPTSVGGPSYVLPAATEAEILQVGEAIASLYPADAVITNIVKTTQVSYVKDPAPEPPEA